MIQRGSVFRFYTSTCFCFSCILQDWISLLRLLFFLPNSYPLNVCYFTLAILSSSLFWKYSAPKGLPIAGMSEGQQIRFDDGIQPVISHSGGVYNLRERSRTGTGSIGSQSLNRTTSKEQDLESIISGVEARDIHKKQVRCSSLHSS